VSDGLAQDLAHVAIASGVRVVIDAEAVPCAADISALDALRSGEEYEVAFTAASTLDLAAGAAAGGVAITRIGRVEQGAPGVEVHRAGRVVELTRGFDHFS
jgi:thiamine-monophosphate kinase